MFTMSLLWEVHALQQILKLWVAAQRVEPWIHFHVVQERRVFAIGSLKRLHCCFGLAQSDLNHGKLVLGNVFLPSMRANFTEDLSGFFFPTDQSVNVAQRSQRVGA